MSENLEKAFEELKKTGQNNVENLVKWMKDSKIIDQAKESEDKARKLFEDCKKKNDVELAKFREVVTKVAQEKKRNLEEFTAMLAQQGPKLLSALEAAGKAFKDTMNKK